MILTIRLRIMRSSPIDHQVYDWNSLNIQLLSIIQYCLIVFSWYNQYNMGEVLLSHRSPSLTFQVCIDFPHNPFSLANMDRVYSNGALSMNETIKPEWNKKEIRNTIEVLNNRFYSSQINNRQSK